MAQSTYLPELAAARPQLAGRGFDTEMATGRPPFEGTVSTLVTDAILHATPASPRGINPLVPVTRPVEMTFPRFQYCFVNTLPEDQQRAAYDRYAVPESRGIPTQSLTSVAHIDFKKSHAPLLITGGERDHLIPASLSRATYRRYSSNGSVTDLKVFPARDHFVIGEPGWQEVADFVLSWLDQKVGS